MLGLDEHADEDAVRAARRRLAKGIHPDVRGGDAEAMRQLNEAADIVLEELAGSPARESDVRQRGFRSRWQSRPASGVRQHASGGVDHDVSSFVIEALPVEAFGALLVVTTWIGEVVVDEPPYQLDVLLVDPLRCWCRLDLVPDAGASMVSVTIAAFPDESLPDIDDVRDLWVSSLNRRRGLN